LAESVGKEDPATQPPIPLRLPMGRGRGQGGSARI